MMNKGLVIRIMIVVSFFLVSCTVKAQDPVWLKRWEEASTKKPKVLQSKSRIAPFEEPGTPMVIRGQVFLPNERPAAGVIVHAYHRDINGFDFGDKDRMTSTWRLQGWAVTDSKGYFEFSSIRPAPDHLGREGAHIHITLISETYGKQWAPTVFLADDPAVT
ncbi:MAG: hypothetical protein AAFO69_18945, partial [Bacteroidota bacterium]